MKIIAKGVQGIIILYTNKKTNKKSVLKIPFDEQGMKEIQYEKRILKYLHRKMNNKCRKYFPKLLKTPDGLNDKTTIALEYIDGMTLYDYLIKHKGNSEQLKKIMKLVKRAIVCLWKHGIIHGDAHLDNIMVTKKHKIKVVDFGQAIKVRAYTKSNTMKDYKKWFYPKWTYLMKKRGIPFGNPNITLLGNMFFQTYSENTKNLVSQALQRHLKKTHNI